MGYYVNPPSGTKEQWLREKSVPTSVVRYKDLPSDKALLCLVDNGFFTALGVCYSQQEIDAFASEDGRPKRWYVASREDLYPVSDIKPEYFE